MIDESNSTLSDCCAEGNDCCAYCCAEGNDDVLRQLIASGSVPAGEVNHCLMLATEKGHTECIRLLLSVNGIDVDYSMGCQFRFATPLMLATEKGHTECVRLLLSVNGINVNVTSMGHQSATPLYVASSRGYIEIVRLLLSHDGIDVNATDEFINMKTPLQIACERGHTDIVKLLLSHDAHFFRDDDSYYRDFDAEIVRLLEERK